MWGVRTCQSRGSPASQPVDDLSSPLFWSIDKGVFGAGLVNSLVGLGGHWTFSWGGYLSLLVANLPNSSQASGFRLELHHQPSWVSSLKTADSETSQPSQLHEPIPHNKSLYIIRFRMEGTYVYLWLIHADIWQKSTQYCKAIILQLKKKEKNKANIRISLLLVLFFWRALTNPSPHHHTGRLPLLAALSSTEDRTVTVTREHLLCHMHRARPLILSYI